MMVLGCFRRRVSLKGGANHGWFVAALHAGCRLKGVQNIDDLHAGCRLNGVQFKDGL